MNRRPQPLPLSPQTAWRWLGPAALALPLLVIALLWPTAQAMLSVWLNSDTFAHGLAVVPISLWLIWRQRGQLARVTPSPALAGLLLLGLAGLAWLLGTLADVQLVSQLALVVMILASVWTLLGTAVVRVILFPLGFLLFAVPMGEGLIAPLMDFTAVFTVAAIRLTGIPVYAEGHLISLPTGEWSVVEACSGIRYLIASVTVGALFAYLTYQHYWKRGLFMLAAVLLPILANGLRAFMIVMIGHFSEMRLAVGMDHVLYGWVFFGAVMLGMFWIGGRFGDPDPAPREPPSSPAPSLVGVGRALTLTLALILIWPAWAWGIRAGDARPPALGELALPLALGDWAPVDAEIPWQPQFIGADREQRGILGRGEERLGVQLVFYADQRAGHELVNVGNVLLRSGDNHWRQVARATEALQVGDRELAVRSLQLRSLRMDRLLIYRIDWVDGRWSVGPYRAKAEQALAKLLGRDVPAAALLLFTPYERDGVGVARARLQAVLQAHLEGFAGILKQAAGQP